MADDYMIGRKGSRRNVLLAIISSKKDSLMSSIVKHFQTLTQIPHCSKEADKLLDFLVSFAKERGYSAEVDEVKNIFISKGTPTL